MTTYIMYGGKGGVGKTTVAAATARHMAEQGAETLVVSTDPAHSLGDVFDRDLDSTPTRIDADRELFGLEVDPTQRFDAEYADTFEDLLAEARSLGLRVDSDDLPEVEGSDVIGSGELAVVDLLARYQEDDEWDYVVFDTAPTGHTLQLLRLPEILDSTVGTVLEIKSRIDTVTNAVTGLLSDDEDDGLDEEEIDDLRSVVERAAAALQERTLFRPVMEAERLSMLETDRLLGHLDEYDVGADVVVANKVLTDVDEDCDLCTRRRDHQQSVLEEARSRFEVPIATVPLLAEPDGPETLATVSEALANYDREG